MKIRVHLTVGDVTYQMEIEEREEKETLHKAIVLGNPPRYCQVCKNGEYFKLDSNKDKEGNAYINMVCIKDGCYAKAKLGSYKAGGYFWHKFEQYKRPEKSQSTMNTNPEDISFGI